jgi:hypothetical protein
MGLCTAAGEEERIVYRAMTKRDEMCAMPMGPFETHEICCF